jgi:hypothetical protein
MYFPASPVTSQKFQDRFRFCKNKKEFYINSTIYPSALVWVSKIIGLHNSFKTYQGKELKKYD